MQNVKLSKKALWSFDGHPGMQVAIDNGLVWLTQEADDRDILIPSGNQFVLDRVGKVILEAVEESQLQLEQGPSDSALLASAR